MAFNDKSSVLSRVRDGEHISLELGCGPRKRNATAAGVDALDYPGVDIVGDVFEVLAALPAGSVSAVHAYHFLEHVPDLNRLLDEIARVMTPGGQVDVEVPHFANPYFYSDPTHHRFFGLYTFCYLASSKLFRRRVPSYERDMHFELLEVRLQFDSPFLVRKGLRRILLTPLFNASRWLQEFHEENLCYLLPVYQVRYVLRRM